MPSAEPPKTTQVLVVGGGPAGAYAAAVLAREGLDVVLLEMSQFPRYHIGESLLPSVRHHLRFIGAEDKVANYGFVRKPGTAIKFNQYMREGYTDFVALGATNNAWNVVRAEFDLLLLRHATACGARVFEGAKVVDVAFEGAGADARGAVGSSSATTGIGSTSGAGPGGMPPVAEEEDSMGAGHELGRPVKATYETALGCRGEIAFEYLVDATGRAGLLSTRYLKNRKFNESLKNVAVWGYWKGTDMYGRGTERENAPFIEALTDESGWAWFIPLHGGITSVGVVMGQKQLGIRSRASSSATNANSSSSSSSTGPGKSSLPPSANRRRSLSARTASTLEARYLGFLQLAPGVVELIGEGELCAVHEGVPDSEHGHGYGHGQGKQGNEKEAPAVRSASDFSYSANVYAGEGWRIVGDAGAFIDPFFSSGVHLALTGALAAGASIAASVRGDCTELEAARWHSSRVAISYTRFLIVVLSAYKQIRAQSENVLADVDERNFDRAFAYLRPVIQGGSDMGTQLSEDELQHALDFCVKLFNPTTPEQHEAVLEALQSLGQKSGPTTNGHTGSGDECAVGCSAAAGEGGESPVGGRELMDVHAPLVDPRTLEKLCLQRRNGHVYGAGSMSSSSPSDAAEIRMVLDKVNARRVIHAEHGNGLHSLEEEEVEGFVVRLRRGELGLKRTGVPE